MTKREGPKGADKPGRAQTEEIRSLRSRLAKLERVEVEHGPSEDVYRSIVMGSPQDFLVLQDGRVAFANPAMADLTGYSVDELKAASPEQIRDFVHPDDREVVWDRHSDRLAGKPAPEHYEFRALSKDGHVRWISVSTREIDYAGRPAVHAAFTDVTERREAELRLEQSNDLLRAIIEAAPTAVVGLDLDGNVHTVWNQAAEKMLGWTAQEAMGHPLPSVPEAGREEFRGFRERIRDGLTLNGAEVRRQRKDGTPIDYSIYASPLHDATGRITGNVAVLVDVTEHKRMEAALHKSQEELEEAQRLAHVGHWEHDLNANSITGSDEALRIFGATPQQRSLGLAQFLDMIHPEDRERVARTVAEALRDRNTFEMTYRVIHPTGKVRFIHSQANVTRDESGRPLCAFGVVQDVTEAKRFERSLAGKRGEIPPDRGYRHRGDLGAWTGHPDDFCQRPHGRDAGRFVHRSDRADSDRVHVRRRCTRSFAEDAEPPGRSIGELRAPVPSQKRADGVDSCVGYTDLR